MPTNHRTSTRVPPRSRAQNDEHGRAPRPKSPGPRTAAPNGYSRESAPSLTCSTRFPRAWGHGAVRACTEQLAKNLVRQTRPPRSAAERSRGLRREAREGLPDGARQRARWRSVAGHSGSLEAISRQGEGSRPSPRSARGAAAECVSLHTSRAPRSGSRQRCPSQCASRARQGGTDLVVVPPQPSEQGAARGAALGAMKPKGVVGAETTRHSPSARLRRARFGASDADKRLRSGASDATNHARGNSRERRE
jgi:hypothetical protein